MEIIEHTFAPGITRLTLPLPTGPRHVHCYVVDGTLFDTGLGIGEVAWPEVERIAITHMHPDHVGGASAAAEATGAPVFQGGLDYAQCERVWGSRDWPERMAEWFLRHGVPAESAQELIEQGHAFAPFVRYSHDPELLYEGSELDGWQVLELPGHADGHLGFLRDGILVGGDTLLDPITPAVGLYPESRPDPLGDYLATLDRLAELAPAARLPGPRRADRRRRRPRPGARRAPPRAARRDRRGAVRRAAQRLRDLPRPLREAALAHAPALRRRGDALAPGAARPGGAGPSARKRREGDLYWAVALEDEIPRRPPAKAGTRT